MVPLRGTFSLVGEFPRTPVFVGKISEQLTFPTKTKTPCKRTSRMLPTSSLVFRDRFANEKAPPAISLRLFQRDHFVETAPQGACQQDCLLGTVKQMVQVF